MAAQTERLRALVVEDEYLVSLSLTSLLEDLGFEVVGPAARLDEACVLASRETLTFAVLDINLAGEMSWPAARVLQSRGVPFLFLSGYLESNATRPPDLMGVPMFRKPLVALDLLGVLEILLHTPEPA